MRDTRTLMEFFDGEYGLDETASREDTIGHFPRVDGVESPYAAQ